MSFRRDGKEQHRQDRDWSRWIDSVAELVAAADLPPSLTASERDWLYFIEHGYSQAGYLGKEPWFSIDSLTVSQNKRIWQLVKQWHQERCPDAPDYQLKSLRITFDPSAHTDHPGSRESR